MTIKKKSPKKNYQSVWVSIDPHSAEGEVEFIKKYSTTDWPYVIEVRLPLTKSVVVPYILDLS